MRPAGKGRATSANRPEAPWRSEITDSRQFARRIERLTGVYFVLAGWDEARRAWMDEIRAQVRDAGLRLLSMKNCTGYVSGSGFECPYAFCVATPQPSPAA